jgi:hypothetical protein
MIVTGVVGFVAGFLACRILRSLGIPLPVIYVTLALLGAWWGCENAWLARG